MPEPVPGAGPVVVVEDDLAVLKVFTSLLAVSGFANVEGFFSGEDFLRFLERVEPEVVVLDLSIPGFTDLDLLRRTLELRPSVAVVMATANDSVDAVVRCVRIGAFDYLVKPVDGQRLVTTVRRAAAHRELMRENTALAAGLSGSRLADESPFAEIVTTSPAMRSLFHYIAGVAPSSQPVLVTGETGVGKELFARAVHAASGRRGKLVTANVAGLDDSTFSDTLFGHRRGAFTGALDERRGLVAEAEGGTLLLDEIGDLAQASQVKLLRLIQEREFTPLGSDVPKKSSARFVFATNRDLPEAVRAGIFRQDLFYRLTTHWIRVPPLRDRREDLPLLVDRFLDFAAAEFGIAKPKPPRALFIELASYPFPGNVRELRALVFDAVARNGGANILPLSFFKSYVDAAAPYPGSAGPTPVVRFGPRLPTLDALKGMLIEEAMRRSDGNKTAAAESIGITRQAINLRERRQRESQPEIATADPQKPRP